MRRSRGGVRGVPIPPSPLENENLLNLRNKIIANMPITPLGKHNYPSNPTPLWKNFPGSAHEIPRYEKDLIYTDSGLFKSQDTFINNNIHVVSHW